MPKVKAYTPMRSKREAWEDDARAVLRQAMGRNNISQTQMADALGVSQSAVCMRIKRLGFTLGDLFLLDPLLHFTDAERAIITGARSA